MQVITCMQPKRSSSPADTRQRLLAAAARVYGRDGLNGATTRAIADEAGVNEVTLFRHFQTKDRLLAAVVGQNFGDAPSADQPPLPAPTDDLRADLSSLARRYESLLAENLPLVRAMLGEIQHHGREHEKHVFKGVFRPVKEALAKRLEAARAAGELRPGFSGELLADLLGGMLFTGVLRRSMRDAKLEYSASAHLEAAVELVLRGAAAERRKA
jgi:AcrR family transcriptional regulator